MRTGISARRLPVFITRLSWLGYVMRFLVGGNRGPDPSTKRAADNRAITTTDFITDCRTGGATYATTYCRIQGRTVRTGFNSRQHYR